MPIRIATWNVNSLNVRLPHVLRWLEAQHTADQPIDYLCLQELKLPDEKFPITALEAAGYSSVFAGQKTYNGVAILARQPLEKATDIVRNIPGFEDSQQRVVAASYPSPTPGAPPLRLICAYFPNGQAVGSEKFAYKMAWLQALTAWLKDELQRHPNLALLGDYNIAPEDRDAHPDWKDEIHVSQQERAAFQALLDLGLRDAFRQFEQAEKIYSWWDYRMMAFRRNVGLRIDHILLSPQLASDCTQCHVDKVPRKWEQPSDHTPVIATLHAN